MKTEILFYKEGIGKVPFSMYTVYSTELAGSVALVSFVDYHKD